MRRPGAEFVSYRHDDTSLVRDARDQGFLLDVKKQYGPTLSATSAGSSGSSAGRSRPTRAALDDGSSTCSGRSSPRRSLRVRQVQFQVDLLPIGANPCSCDTASPQQISPSVTRSCTAPRRPPKQSDRRGGARGPQQAVPRLPLVASPTPGLSARRAAARTPFPLEYPRVQDAGGSVMPVSLRNYLIHARAGHVPAYVAVFSAGRLGQYYDVQGMTWTGAPMFANPDQTVTVGGRTYYLYYSGQHLRMVAWFEHGAVYWVHNTLSDASATVSCWRSPSRPSRSAARGLPAARSAGRVAFD